MHPDRQRWNERYRGRRAPEGPDVNLIMYQGRLSRGRALDVAGGRGENAAILALAGWDVTLCDLSDAAVAAARARARELKADVGIVQADALRLPFRGPFDLVVCTYYLERAIAPTLASLLRPGGTLFVESFTVDHAKYKPDLRREYLLERGELRKLFALEEILYREEDDGVRATALLIARKP